MSTEKKQESYAEMRARHQKEFNQLPIHAAFGDAQIKRVLAELNLSEDKNAENYYGTHIVSLGFGTFILKEDVPHYLEVIRRQKKELDNAIAADKTGLGFIKDMFLCELQDHEFGYTGDPSDALAALGYTEIVVEKDSALKAGFEKACKEALASE